MKTSWEEKLNYQFTTRYKTKPTWLVNFIRAVVKEEKMGLLEEVVKLADKHHDPKYGDTAANMIIHRIVSKKLADLERDSKK